MVRKVVQLCMSGIVSVALYGSLCGDTIKFKDGTDIQGQIVAEMGDVVMIQFQGNVEKVSRDSILKIIKSIMPQAEQKPPKQRRFKIEDTKNTSLAEIANDLDSWFEKLEPMHQKNKKALRTGLVASTLSNTDGMILWLSGWSNGGLSTIGLDDIQETLQILKWVQRPLTSDIRMAGILSGCSSCRGSKRSICRKCRGRGKTRSGKGISYSIGKSGVRSKTTIKMKKCSDCRGSGRMACRAGFHIAEKRIKKMGGIEKASELLSLASKHHLKLPGILVKASKEKYAHGLKDLAGELYREGYYYMSLEILRRIERKEKK